MGADLATQPYEIRSFKGGLTDTWVDGQKNMYARADNLLLGKDENPYSRPGSVLFDSAHPQLPQGQVRINRLVNYDVDAALLGIQGQYGYRYNAGWTLIPGPAAAPTFPAPVNAATHFQIAQWKKMVFAANDSGAFPTILYPGQGGTWLARTMGLPALPKVPNYVASTQLTAAIALANDIRRSILLHVVQEPAHLQIDGVAQGILTGTPVASDLPTLLTLANSLMRAFTEHQLDAYSGDATYHSFVTAPYQHTPPDHFRLISTVPVSDLPSAARLLNDIQTKYNAHDAYYSATAGAAIHAANPAQQSTAAQMPALSMGPNFSTTLTTLIGAANTLNTFLTNHLGEYGSTGPSLHKESATSAGRQVSTSYTATDWNSLITLCNLMAMIYTDHEWDSEEKAPGTGVTVPAQHWALTTGVNRLTGVLQKPSGTGQDTMGFTWDLTSVFLDPLTATQADVAAFLTDFQNKFNSHDKDPTAHLPTSGTGNHIGQAQSTLLIPEIGNYTYALHYDYTYTVNGITFEVAGPVTVLELTNVGEPALSPVTIQNIPVLANTTGTQYDLGQVQIKIYRTLRNQQALNLVDTIPNGTTSWTDRADDDSILTNLIYTTGGIPNSDPPPAAKFICQSGDKTYFANYVDSLGNSFPNRILQGSPAAPENAPGSFYCELPQDVMGIAKARNYVIAWTSKKTYRIDGAFTIDGQGSMTATVISETVGLGASYSPVSFDDGVIFWGSDGIYFTNGFQVHRLSRYWSRSYAQLLAISPNNVQGDFDPTPAGRRIWWTMQTPADDTGLPTDTNACLILDLNHDPSNTENSVFTTASNLSYFAPSSLCFFQGQLIRGDTRGYAFKHDELYTSDPKVNTATTPSTWSTVPIFYDLISSTFDFDSIRSRKWVPSLTVTCKNQGTNLSLQINSNNDDGKQFAALSPIHFRGAPKLAGKDALGQKLQFGNYTPESNRALIKEKRRFPAGHLRCDTKQLQFTNAYCVVGSSDLWGVVSVTLGGGGVPQIVLSTGNWPVDMVDQVLSFSVDGYSATYTVLTQSGNTITTTNPGFTCPTGSNLLWQARGYPKNEKFRLVNYVISFALLGTEQTTASEGDGGNAP